MAAIGRFSIRSFSLVYIEQNKNNKTKRIWPIYYLFLASELMHSSGSVLCVPVVRCMTSELNSSRLEAFSPNVAMSAYYKPLWT